MALDSYGDVGKYTLTIISHPPSSAPTQQKLTKKGVMVSFWFSVLGYT